MSEQLHHLLRMSVRPNVEIRVIPDEQGFHAAQKPFKLMEFTEFHPVAMSEEHDDPAPPLEEEFPDRLG